MAAALAAPQQQSDDRELLRLLTCGSVDDGKSTLIGRLLYDTQGAYEDQLAAIRKGSVNRSTGPIDLSLLTDGLRAEREQGITIDVAYRYFQSTRRKFIIADTPGHVEYTRNMVTGASTAQLAIILIDARQGVLPQSRRHAAIAGLLGIPHVVVAVNKMDLVGWDESVFRSIEQEFRPLLAQVGLTAPVFLPVSALDGDNVATRSSRASWYWGPSLLEVLEETPATPEQRTSAGLRFPVQIVIRPHQDFRGYAGQVAAGTLRVGDPVLALPSGQRSRIKSIVTFDGELREAKPPSSVTVTLEDERDISRGDMLVHPSARPQVSARFRATLVALHHEPLRPGYAYLLKHTTRQISARILQVSSRLNIETLTAEPAHTLLMNEIGEAEIESGQPLVFDRYQDNRTTGAFILIDPLNNATVAAGLIRGAVTDTRERNTALHAVASHITPGERMARFGHEGHVVGLPGDWPELAALVERRLFVLGAAAYWLPQATPESFATLRQAGLLILTYGSGDVIFARTTLPRDVEAAADAVVSAVMTQTQEFDQGGGV